MDKDELIKFLENRCAELWTENESLKFQLHLMDTSIKKNLDKFYHSYWLNSYEGDKCKKHITCDELDYLLNKHLGNIINIKSLQRLDKRIEEARFEGYCAGKRVVSDLHRKYAENQRNNPED